MENCLKKNIELRKEVNLSILDKLEEIVEEYPDMRFGQILFNYLLEYDDKGNIKDPFYEESTITYERLRNNMGEEFREKFC